MHPKRRQRSILVIVLIAISALAITLIVRALNDNLNLFYPPETIVSGDVPIDVQVRAGGCVVPGSVTRSDETLKVSFSVTDGEFSFPVVYEGLLPDLFAEGDAVVIKGKLRASGEFAAIQVLAKHDENYMPPEVAEAMKKSDEEQHAATCKTLTYAS